MPTEQSPNSPRGEQLEQLIRRASEQPGLAELLAVYQNWSASDAEVQAFTSITAPRAVVSAASHVRTQPL